MSEDTHATELTRRRMLQGAAAALTVATGTVVIGLAGPGGGAATAADPGASDSFDEVFQGRRIQGRPADGGATTTAAAPESATRCGSTATSCT